MSEDNNKDLSEKLSQMSLSTAAPGGAGDTTSSDAATADQPADDTISSQVAQQVQNQLQQLIDLNNKRKGRGEAQKHTFWDTQVRLV